MDLVWGSVEKYFLEVGAYVSLKRVTTGVQEGRYCWILVKMSLFLKFKSRAVESKSFIL